MEADPNPPTHLQGTSGPGRVVHQSGVRGTSTVQAPDYHARAEADFLALVASALDTNVRSKSIHAVIIVAPPHALATLRGSITPVVSAVLRAEITKDLVKEPLDKITADITASPGR